MTRLTKTSFFALLGLTVAFAGSTDAFACGRRGGGGGYGGYGGSYSYAPSYAHAPNYSQPVYRQPVVQQPVTPLVRQQPVVQRQPVQQQFVQQQPVQQQGVQQQAIAQQPVRQQGIAQQPAAQQPVAQQPVQQQAISQQPVQTAQAPVQTPQAQAPVQTPQTQASAQSPAQTPVQTPPASDVEKSALELLSQFGAVETTQPETTMQAQSQGFDGVGNWSATLGNGASISLELRADGSFTWIALKNGKPSTFSGTFALDGESLTLIRSDRQQLNGTLIAPGANGFTFKLDGVKDNGLQFARS